MQSNYVVFWNAYFTWYKFSCNRTLKPKLGGGKLHIQSVIMFHAVSGSSHLFNNRPTSAPTRKMAGRYATTKHNKPKKAQIFLNFTYLFRRRKFKNTGLWSYLRAIIQIHSIFEEVFPLMPAWKLPSSWQPEAEENGSELASPKVNMAAETRSLTVSDRNAHRFCHSPFRIREGWSTSWGVSITI